MRSFFVKKNEKRKTSIQGRPDHEKDDHTTTMPAMSKICGREESISANRLGINRPTGHTARDVLD
jgi:hypothetical protein